MQRILLEKEKREREREHTRDSDRDSDSVRRRLLRQGKVDTRRADKAHLSLSLPPGPVSRAQRPFLYVQFINGFLSPTESTAVNLKAGLRPAVLTLTLQEAS